MSLRYAHLAPDQRREAVAKLNEKPIFSLSIRLPSYADRDVFSQLLDGSGERRDSSAVVPP